MLTDLKEIWNSESRSILQHSEDNLSGPRPNKARWAPGNRSLRVSAYSLEKSYLLLGAKYNQPSLNWICHTPCCLWVCAASPGFFRASQIAPVVKNSPAMQKTQVSSLGEEDPLEKEMTTHSSVLAWEVPWTAETNGLQSMGSQKSQTWLSTHAHMHIHTHARTRAHTHTQRFLQAHKALLKAYAWGLHMCF